MNSFPLVEDLYTREGLARLDARFLEHLESASPDLHHRLLAARRGASTPGAAMENKAQSELIIELAAHLEDFVGDWFGIRAELAALQARENRLAPLYSIKRKFVQRRALSGTAGGMTAEQAAAIDGESIADELAKRFGEPLTELAFAAHVSQWLEAESQYELEIGLAVR